MNEYIGEGVKAVLFDHDDTLVGTIRAKRQQNKHVARVHYGRELTDEEIDRYWGKPMVEYLCLIYGTDDPEQAIANHTLYRDKFPKELFPATIPTLRRLRLLGRFAGIITAASRLSFEHDVDSHKIPRELLDYTQTADDTPFHKPDKRVFDPVLDWLKVRAIKPEEVIYVGDGLHDMQAAGGAGFEFIGVETGLVTADKFRAVGAKSIPSIASLLD